MGCEKAKGGFMAAIRSSMERRRVSNAKGTSLRQRKYQELTMQREQENLQRAKEILERRKSERDRLNAYMHSVANPHAKHPDNFRGMRRPNTEGTYGRPPWTASLRSDYETLIKLREKEIAVATLRIENHKQLPHKSMHLEAKDMHKSNASDDTHLLKKEFEFHHERSQPEFGDECFDTSHKSDGSFVRNDLKDLETELVAFTNEAEKYHKDIGTDLLRIEPTVFREHSFNGLRSGARSLPPRAPTSNPKVVTPPLKSCLKSNKDNRKSFSPLLETPRTFSKAFSERSMSCGISQSTLVATSNMETARRPVSNGPRATLMTMTQTNSTIKASMNHFLDPETLSWGDHEDMDYDKDSFNILFDMDCKEHPEPEPADGISIPEHIPEQTFSMSTISKVVSSEEKASTAVPVENTLPKHDILRPITGRQMESGSPDMLSCYDIDTMFQETKSESLDSSKASSPDSVQKPTTAHLNLPPRYTSATESWQEDREFESSAIPNECHTLPLLSPTGKHEENTWGSEEEMFITSLDSEAATTRLIAEIIAVQSRLEDCKLKPMDFRNIFAEPPYPGKACSRLEHPDNVKWTPSEDSSGMPSPPDDGHELAHSQNEQGVIEVNMRNHEIFMTEDTSHHDIWESILDEGSNEERTTENASNTAGASSVDDHEKEMTTAHQGTDRIDNFTEMPALEDMESRKILRGAAWEIPWYNEAGKQRRRVELIADLGYPSVRTEQSANSSAPVSPFPCTITEPLKPVGSTLPVDFHLEEVKPVKSVNDQQPCVRHVMLQTDDDPEQSGENPRCHSKSAGISTNRGVLHCVGVANTGDHSDCSLMSMERTSKYLNIGYRDLSEAPRPKYPKQHCFYSSHGLLQVGYSQPRQPPPQTIKQNILQNRNGQPCRFHDSLGDKENNGTSGADDQELSILASLERLDWKLAAISARAMNRTSTTPSLLSQNQTSIQSAPAATGVKGASADGTPRKFPVHPLRPSSVRTQKPPTRNFRQRRIVGVTNKFHQDIYN